MNRLLLIGLFAAWALLPGVTARAQESRPPLPADEIMTMLRTAEAQRPSEEIIELIRKFGVDFQLKPEIEAKLRAVATEAKRPDDLIRQVVQATQENWIFDRLRTMLKKDDGLELAAQLIRERAIDIPYDPALETDVLRSGAGEQAVTLLWPPEAPEKPRFRAQEWRTPRQNAPRTKLRYNPDAVRGEVTMDVVVDGRVLVVLKHNLIYYNVICGRDIEISEAAMTSPLPRLPREQWDYTVELRKKARGKVFACPQDPRCRLAGEDTKKGQAERLCAWEDIGDGSDGRGYSNARFIVDDPQSGAAAYQVTLSWTVKPYTAEWLIADLRKYGAARTVDKIYARGAAMKLDAQLSQQLRDAGANDRVLGEINRNYRSSNAAAPKVH